MIMGANVGTSITSTIVAFGNSAEKEEFARAMASAYTELNRSKSHGIQFWGCLIAFILYQCFEILHETF